jgi:radical SAM protein with 4Fe4S-binding SPASM domain
MEPRVKDKQYYLKESPYFCMYPWVHMHVWPKGETYPCCVADSDKPVGDTKRDTLEKIWNDKPMREIRKRLIADKPVKACRKCYEQDQHGAISPRISANREWADFFHIVEETTSKGEVQPFKMHYLDIRYSNVCNFKCRTCGPGFSTTWWDDTQGVPGFQDNGPRMLTPTKEREDLWRQLEPQIQYVEAIYFAGGEPLITEEHYLILEKLISLKKTQIPIRYNTNFSILKYARNDVVELWKQFENVSIAASIDGGGRRGEYLRSGMNYDRVLKNRERVLAETPHVDFYLSPTVSAMNAYHILDLHKEWYDRGFIRKDGVFFNILQDPEFFRLQALPSKVKPSLIQRYEEHLSDFVNPSREPEIQRVKNTLGAAISFLKAENLDHLAPKALERLRVFDRKRNEDFFDVFPEHRETYSDYL